MPPKPVRKKKQGAAQESSLSGRSRLVVAAVIIALAAVMVKFLADSHMGITKDDMHGNEGVGGITDMKEMALQLTDNFQRQSISLPPFQSMMNWSTSAYMTSSSSSLGSIAREKGWYAKHPVVLVPGFVTSGLEVWEGLPCSKKTVYFRGRLWGRLEMVQAFLRDSDCWFKHMQLDEEGMDPEGIKVRAAHGLAALDYFMEGFWVFSKLIEALGQLGYEPELNLIAAPYDWRLSVPTMEVRDRYFTRLKQSIEGLVAINKVKVVLISHSYGENVARALITWAGGPWCEKHLEGIVNLAGPTLGIPKAISALLSGEMKDTATLGPLSAYLANAFVPVEARTRLFRSWGSLLAMLPAGGENVWGSLGPMLKLENGLSVDNFHAHDAVRFMLKETGLEANFDKWGARVRGRPDNLPFFPDATRVPLPPAPSMKIYCIYGVGLQTEQAYTYRSLDDANVSSLIRWKINATHHDPSNGIENGILSSDGDLTVPLISLGAMCVKGWRGSKLNPSGIRIVVREKNHALAQLTLDPRERGGATSAHHVDVLGNEGLLNDVLAIVSGHGEELVDEIVSSIDQIVEGMDFQN